MQEIKSINSVINCKSAWARGKILKMMKLYQWQKALKINICHKKLCHKSNKIKSKIFVKKPKKQIKIVGTANYLSKKLLKFLIKLMEEM